MLRIQILVTLFNIKIHRCLSSIISDFEKKDVFLYLDVVKV